MHIPQEGVCVCVCVHACVCAHSGKQVEDEAWRCSHLMFLVLVEGHICEGMKGDVITSSANSAAFSFFLFFFFLFKGENFIGAAAGFFRREIKPAHFLLLTFSFTLDSITS